MTSPFEHCSLDENLQSEPDRFKSEMTSANESDAVLNVMPPSQFSTIIDTPSQTTSSAAHSNFGESSVKTIHNVESPCRDIGSRSAKRDSDGGTGGTMRPFSVQTTRNNSLSSGIFSLKSTTDSTASASSSSMSPASSTSSVEMLDLELHRMKTSTKFAYATLVAVLLGDSCR